MHSYKREKHFLMQYPATNVEGGQNIKEYYYLVAIIDN